MSRRQTIGWALGLAALASAALAWALRPTPVDVRVATAIQERFELAIEEEGVTRVASRFLLSAPVSGQISRMQLNVGDRVSAGQMMAQIEAQKPSMIDWRTQLGLRERVAASEASMLGAAAAKERAATALALAQADLARTEELARQGFLSAAVLQTSSLTLRQRQQALIEAEMTAEAARHELAAARAALIDATQPIGTAGSQASLAIRAPIDGRLLRVIQENEAFVLAGAPLYELGSLDHLEAVVEVLSQDASALREGMPARLSIDLGPPRHAGRVRRVEPVARTRISALGVEEQRVRVIVDFEPAPPAEIGDGWRINAALVTLNEPSVTLVPNGALMRRGTAWTVFTVAEGRARRQVIELGARNARSAWVRSGLIPGDVVVLHPPESLREGVRVRPIARSD